MFINNAVNTEENPKEIIKFFENGEMKSDKSSPKTKIVKEREESPKVAEIMESPPVAVVNISKKIQSQPMLTSVNSDIEQVYQVIKTKKP